MAIEVLIGEASAAVLRAQGFFATAGGNGVALPADLRVRATEVAGSSVRVIRGPSGVAVARDPRPSRAGQSFVTVTSETELVPVPATDSSGGKTRWIIQYVDDQQTMSAFHVCVDDLAPYALIPHVVLARIDQPASTATITNGMITGLRRMAYPLEHTVTHPYAQVQGNPGFTLVADDADGEYFPNAGWADFEIPWWASHMKIEATWTHVHYSQPNAYGRCWVEWGPSTGTQTRQFKTQEYGFNGAAGTSNTWNVFAQEPIPEFLPDGVTPLRGSTQRFIYKARYTSTDKGVSINALSGNNLRVTFQMVAD